MTADDLNAHFAAIASDRHYSRDELQDILRIFGDCDTVSFTPFTADFLTTVLGRIRSTSPGPEEIPFCYIKHVPWSLGQ